MTSQSTFKRNWLVITTLAALVVISGGATAGQAEQVTFSSLDGTLLTAHVFQPEDSPLGTVIALHGCGGLYATRGSRAGQLNARHQAMADLLTGQGYAAVFPDSLRPRNETELCTQKIGLRKIDQTERRADALAAIAWAAAQPWTPPGHIALLGWSHGGSAVLSATDGSRADVRQQTTTLAVAIAFYPGCAGALKSGYRPASSLVMMLGEKDDWTPPEPCIALGKRIGAEVNVYADSYHGFDAPTGSVELRRDVPNGVNPGQGVHVGPNPAARQAAYARLLAVLAKAFALPTRVAQ